MSIRRWTFALHLVGTRPDRLPLDACAEYLKQFAQLLGKSDKVHFAGAVKGSVVLRAAVDSQAQFDVFKRFQVAKTQPDSDPARAVQALHAQLRRDRLEASVKDREGRVILDFPARPEPEPSTEVLVHDTGTLEGMVVGIEGADDTVHVRLRDADDQDRRAVLRDMAQAREIANRFRGQAIRLHVHGTWKRTPEGQWKPETVYVDRYEDLEEDDALAVFEDLRAIPGNGWAEVEDPLNAWQDVRG